MSDIDEGSERGSLVVRPGKLLHSVLEGFDVVLATTNVDDEVAIRMLLFQVGCYFVDVIAIRFLNSSLGGESHCDDPGSDVGEI